MMSRIAGWLLAIAIVILSLVPSSLRPETGLPHDLEHFGIFWALGAAFGLGYGESRVRLAACLVIFSGAVELAQFFVPGRHARLSDFIVDALAVCVGALSIWLAQAVFAPRARAEAQ